MIFLVIISNNNLTKSIHYTYLLFFFYQLEVIYNYSFYLLIDIFINCLFQKVIITNNIIIII